MKSIIFFDGVCHLCNSFVDFILRRDVERTFFLAPLQGETAKSYLSESDRRNLDTIILWEDGKVYYRSEAVLRVIGRLDGYRWFLIFKAIPESIRNSIYRFVAKRRYQLFGKMKTCRIPSGDEQVRFLN